MTADNDALPDDLPETAWRRHREGDLATARRLYATILERRPGDPDALHRLGVLCYQEGQAAAALGLLGRARAARPDDPGILRHHGAVLLAAGRREEAAQAFRHALEVAPDDPETTFNLGLTLRQLGEYRPAIALLEAAAAAGLDHLALVRYELALARQMAGDRVPALAGYRRTLELAPDHVDALNNLGVLLQQGGDVDGAVAAYRAALAVRPDFVPALNNLGSALEDRGEPEAAAAVLEQALALAPDFADAWNTLGTVRRGQGRREEAVAAYRTALRHQPLSATTHDNLAECLRELGRAEEALESSRAVVAAWPGEVRALHIRGEALKRAGDPAGVVEVCRAALALATPGCVADSHHRLGAALVAAGAVIEGIEHLRQAAALEPRQPPILRELAAALLRACDGAGAVAVCDRALAHDRFDQEALAGRALGLRLAGDAAGADVLVDLQRWINQTAPILPAAAGGFEEFNRRLARDLIALKSRKWQPATQSIRGGTQTQNNIFTEPLDSIVLLRQAIDAAIGVYLATLDKEIARGETVHPFLAGRPRRYGYRGWSVILDDQGYHVPHIHPEGWLSGAYYVQVPDFAPGEDPGCIEVGRPWAELPFAAPPPTRRVAPAAGKLVLFPSYFWHGVRPFRSGGQRITVAFDLLPLER